MTGRDMVVIGASAGGVEAVQVAARDLPRDLPAAVSVVNHIAAQAASGMPDFLKRAGLLHASHPRDGEVIRPGHIYVTPPDHHPLVEWVPQALSHPEPEEQEQGTAGAQP